MKKTIEIPGYETIERGPHTVLIRPGWKASLLEDLLGDFASVAPQERRVYGHGRVEHFSYSPRGASGRIFIRRATRGGLIGAVLGGLYAGIERPLR